MTKEKIFPIIIEQYPAADIPIEGLTSHLVQTEQQQFVFMHFEKEAIISEHYHEAQWGVVLSGEIELTIAGEKRNFKKGDSYFIDKNVKHSAKIKAGYSDLTLFNQKDRYKINK